MADRPDMAHMEEGIRIKPLTVGKAKYTYLTASFTNWKKKELEEEGVRISLTIVDTPGFGDNIDNEFA